MVIISPLFLSSALYGLFLAMAQEAVGAISLLETPLWLSQAVSSAIGIFILISCYKRFFHAPLSDMGVKSKNAARDIAYGALFGIASIGAAWGIMAAFGVASTSLNENIPVAGVLFYVPAFMLAAANEELLTRGYLMSYFRRSKMKWPVVFFGPALIFSALHLFNNAIGALPLINIFLFGIVFALAFVKTGSLWMPISYHFFWNYFQGNVLGIPVSGFVTDSIMTTKIQGPTFLSGGAFGAEGSIATTIAAFAAIIALCLIKWPSDDQWDMGHIKGEESPPLQDLGH